MKNIFLYTQTEQQIEASGEVKKAIMQKDALNMLGLETEIYFYNIYSKYYKLFIRLPFFSVYNKKMINKLTEIVKEDTDFIYIRRYMIDKSFIRMVKKLREQYANLKIIFEIPTYPYDREWSRAIDFTLLYKERKYRKFLYKYVDRIVTFSEDSEIFGVKCICTENGIDVNSIKKRNEDKISSKEIHLLAVALFQKAHGYERILQGLRNYYKSENTLYRIYIHFVGEGTELTLYKKLVEQYDLRQYVFFYGKKHGEELDRIFNKCQIALSVLGWYKVGVEKGYPLKTREYCARGIPFVYGYEDPAFADSFEYALHVDNNESAIDMYKVVEFYEYLKSKDSREIVAEMVQYAERYLSWTNAMKKIVEYVEKE